MAISFYELRNLQEVNMYGTFTNIDPYTDTDTTTNEDFWELFEVCRNSKDDDFRLSVKRNLFHVKNNYCVGIKHHNHKSRYFKPLIINRKTCSNHSNFRDKKQLIINEI